MNAIDQTTLTRALISGGFIPSDATPSEPAQLARPWFIGLLLGASGWLAGIFLIVFVGLLFDPSTAGGWLLACAVGFAAAFALYAIDKESAFFDQLALALWFAAQCAFMGLILELTEDELIIAGSVAAMQCVLALLTPNRFAKLIASFFACIAWGLTCRFAVWDEFGFWDSDKKVPLAPAIGVALASWLPVIALIRLLIAKETAWLARGRQRLVRPVLTGLLLGVSFGPLVTHAEVLFPFWSNEPHPVNWLALTPLFAALCAAYALWCAFKLRHTGLMGAAVAGVLLHLAQFYYVLGVSLLMKSIVMLFVGLALLAEAISIAGRKASDEEAS